MTTMVRTRWRVPVALLALTAAPVVAGAFRMTQLGTRVIPVPTLLHIVGASLFCVLGALQFLRGPRHRVIGRLIVPCGLIAALSGMWLAVAPDGDLLRVLRLVFGAVMATALVLGFTAARRRDFAAHRAWMMRGYAIGLGAGSQAVILSVWTPIAGEPGVLTNALLMGLGWVGNLAVAEWFIRRESR